MKLKRFTLLLAVLVMTVISTFGQRQMYPGVYWDNGLNCWSQWDNTKFYKHSLESVHFDVFYGIEYGTTAPDKLPASDPLFVDVQDLLNKAEDFYNCYVNDLKFTEEGRSQLDRYKMGIFIIHTLDWVATGSGNNDFTGALWVSPNTCHPVGSTIAHEIGHSFQFQVFCDYGGNSGFRYSNGNGSSFWEQTAEFQAKYQYWWEAFPSSMGVFRFSHNMAFTHEWHRYQSYWMHFYWADKYGGDMIGRIWRGNTGWGDDPNTVYRKINNMSVADLYKEYMDAAMHFVTWDFQNPYWKDAGKNDIGNFIYDYVQLSPTKFQVSYGTCPQSTGFNIIELKVPKGGTQINTHFTALKPGCALAEGDKRLFWNGDRVVGINTNNYNHFDGESYRGFRLGYVALKKDGTREYYTPDQVFCKGTTVTSADVAYTVPADVERLWLVVSPALSQYITHLWDENILNDDQWPYQVEFSGTTIVGSHMDQYLYDAESDKFLSRGGSWGTQLVVDDYGVPVGISLEGDNSYVLSLKDNAGVYFYKPDLIYTDGGLDAALHFSMTTEGDGTYVLKTADGSVLTHDGMATELKSGATTRWQFLTAAERDAVINRREQAALDKALALAGMNLGGQSLDAYIEEHCKLVDKTTSVTNAALSTSINGWTVSGEGVGIDHGVLENYNNRASAYSQTVRGLEKGLYKVELYAFYRDGDNPACVGYANSGWNKMSNAYLSANDYKVQIADWAGQRANDNYPNWLGEVANMFNNGKYNNVVYTYVGSDGTLDLQIVKPQYVANGWFAFSNLRLTQICNLDINDIIARYVTALNAAKTLAADTATPVCADVLTELNATIQNNDRGRVDESSRTALEAAIQALDDASAAVKNSIDVYADIADLYQKVSNIGCATLPQSAKDMFASILDNVKGKYDARTITDGTQEWDELYNALARSTLTYATTGANLTTAIWNPSFELYGGSTFGWDAPTSGDTGARAWSGTVYNMTNTHGDYVFNTWGTDPAEGTYVRQVVKGFRAGTYRLQAVFATDHKNGWLYAKYYPGGENDQNVFTSFVDANTGTQVTLDFRVPDDNVDIELGFFVDYGWFKTDNFRLTCLKTDNVPPTGIDAMENEPLTLTHTDVYDLQGRKVQVSRPGIYIINGKKVLIK
ncbi:MAG: DUF6055 domain-containing protein [Bacteroidales bacterium]|nr:DUF6055 domain-containing protein [Bacteroidales bacterium]